MLSNDGENGSNPQSNGGIPRGGRDREFRTRHSGCNRSPCRDGRGAVRASFIVLRGNDAPGGRSEEDEEPDVEENRDGGSDKLGDELVLRLGTEEITRLKVTGHVRSLGSRPGGNDTGRQVEDLRRTHGHTSRFSDTAKNELGGLGDGRDRVNVSLTRTLDTDERKEETEDESEDGLSHIEVEHS